MMRAFGKHKQACGDVVKRWLIDLCRRHTVRLNTPADLLLATLNAKGYLTNNIAAVELFGFHGLWQAKDYAHRCSYLELYELDPVYANYARKLIRNAVVINSDSVNAVVTKQLRKQKYTYVISDNPFGSPFGNGYYEHFDLFPHVVDLVDDGGVIHLNVFHSVEPLSLTREHRARREEFYGKASPSLDEIMDVYRSLMSKKQVLDSIFLARNAHSGIAAFVLRDRHQRPYLDKHPTP